MLQPHFLEGDIIPLSGVDSVLALSSFPADP